MTTDEACFECCEILTLRKYEALVMMSVWNNRLNVSLLINAWKIKNKSKIFLY